MPVGESSCPWCQVLAAAADSSRAQVLELPPAERSELCPMHQKALRERDRLVAERDRLARH